MKDNIIFDFDEKELIDHFWKTFNPKIGNPGKKHNKREIHVLIITEQEFDTKIESYNNSNRDCTFYDKDYCEELKKDFENCEGCFGDDFCSGCDTDEEAQGSSGSSKFDYYGIFIEPNKIQLCYEKMKSACISNDEQKKIDFEKLKILFTSVLLHEIGHAMMTDNVLNICSLCKDKKIKLNMLLNPYTARIYHWFKPIEESLAEAYVYYHEWSTEDLKKIKENIEKNKFPYRFALYWINDYNKKRFGEVFDSWGDLKRNKSYLFEGPRRLKYLNILKRQISTFGCDFSNKIWEIKN